MKLRFLRKPSPQEVARYIESRCKDPFSYPEVGATNGRMPAGYRIDRNSTRLGRGEVTFDRAVDALRKWRQFRLPWMEAFTSGQEPAEDLTVGLLIRHRLAWSISVCRVVYTIRRRDDESASFGFAYGTLYDHAEMGEERFEVRWDRGSGIVEYHILAFSRPRHWLAVLGYPLARRLQKRFVTDSLAAMRRSTTPQGVSQPQN